MRAIWQRNQAAIQQEIAAQGFDEIILVPDNLNLPDLHSAVAEGHTET